MNVMRNKNVKKKKSSEMSGIILEIPEGLRRAVNRKVNTCAAGANWPREGVR